MDEEKKIMEKRSSFRGWKERNKGKIQQKRNITVIVIIISVFFILAAYSYWDKIDSDSHVKQQNKTSSSVSKDIKTNLSNNSENNSNKNSSKIVNLTNTTKNSTVPKKNIIGKIGVPLVSNGFEITVKSITPASVYTSVWITVRNKENIEKPFKLGTDTVLIDNIEQQYENIKIARAGIAQTNLSARAMREGAVFFETLKEGRNPKRVILNINNENSEFILS